MRRPSGRRSFLDATLAPHSLPNRGYPPPQDGHRPMTPRHLSFLTTLTFALACNGSSGQGTESDSGSISGTATAANSTGSTGGGTDTGGADHEICDRYIACVAATNPPGLPAAQEGFGADATCWTLDQTEIDICLMACEAGLIQNHASNPSAPECYLCADESECAEGLFCFEGDCTDSACGDGIVQWNEVCDDPVSCPECYVEFYCSPLTNIGCGGIPSEFYCDILPNGDSLFVDCTYFEDFDDCPANSGVKCPPATYCPEDPQVAQQLGCLPYCDLNNPATCPEGLACKQAELQGLVFPSDDPLSYLGMCAP